MTPIMARRFIQKIYSQISGRTLHGKISVWKFAFLLTFLDFTLSKVRD